MSDYVARKREAGACLTPWGQFDEYIRACYADLFVETVQGDTSERLQYVSFGRS